MSDNIRVRFAPSPTGYLHVGGARTALYDYLLAKKEKGTFILRIEDTDLDRSTEEFMRMQMADMKWLGLNWDEGPEFETLKDVGEYGPYRQSQRLDIYKKHIDELLERNLAYYCFHTDEEVKAGSDVKKGHFQSEYATLSLDEAKVKLAAGETAVVRFRHPGEKDYVMDDIVRGEVKFPSDMIGDFVIFRSNGMPVYNFCCVVDDHLMKLTHVFRAEEHLSNSLRQLMIYEAFGWTPPQFAHLSLILGEDKQKLSKRHGATSCNDFRKRGFLPEAVNSYIALLGWSSPTGKEVLKPNELLEEFNLERFNNSGAVFDETKLKWVNATLLRGLEASELWEKTKEYMSFVGESLEIANPKKAVESMKSSVETLAEMFEKLKPLDANAFAISEEGLEALKWETSKAVVEKWIELMKSSSDEISEKMFSEYQNTVKKDCAVKGKNLFMPLRVAVIGVPHGVDLAKAVPLLDRESLISRAEKCIAAISN